MEEVGEVIDGRILLFDGESYPYRDASDELSFNVISDDGYFGESLRRVFGNIKMVSNLKRGLLFIKFPSCDFVLGYKLPEFISNCLHTNSNIPNGWYKLLTIRPLSALDMKLKGFYYE